ncbi:MULTISPECIES: hypothetical protein [unclassified Pedobacter]|uniref:hypothetical protein n=1 Tax=unclassified Pedobacter TaxID=2628915 RepID=UPI001DFD8D3F|nr:MULTISPECIES: hypothetical protein [unclassified Pedobacter]CAH0199297.1 hypothetical protein SRABI36_01954 [Pedobacter sp. Bi36]CAH0254902.1 hypothetical protein SRABI126_03048 [Pedobacter sp. Bi126]
MRLNIGLVLLILFFGSACRKGERITTDPNAKLNISNKEVLFDTIFTSVGSITKRIKIVNWNNDAVKVSEIRLSGGNTSAFSININGEQTQSKNDLIINGRDSINLFVKVSINPNSTNLPFLVQDSIILNTNGNKQVIQLLAYGQNAVFVNESTINANTIWTKALPYIINGSLTVKNGGSLTIQPGTKIYFHKDANLNIEGNLVVNGSLTEPVLFCSDRLEYIYSDEPGQWKGIFLKRTGCGLIKNAIIKNASVGITSDSLSVNNNPKLILSNSTIKNMQVAAYIGYHSELLAFNNVMYNCGNYLIYAVGGGNYNLKQNTFAGYNSNFPRKTAALSFSDYLSANAYNKLQVDLTNNIIWGNLTNELDIQKKTAAIVQFNLWSNLIRSNNSAYSNNGNILNTDPLFINQDLEDFRVSSGSIVRKKGTDLSTDPYFFDYLNHDAKGNARISPSTLGSYEK